ncbi:hypothetical protein [Cereibacter changlensis]|jgi:hypothetical protein|uniref:hypothetical protein n=1 Tax=Cereibacter changlensis TaxID=402884 RepID=UPI004033C91B
MATLAATSLAGPGQRSAAETTLTASNSFTYLPGAGQILVLRNPTGAAVSPVLDGADGTVVPVPGIGNVDVSAGYAVGAIPAGGVKVIPLDTISAYLQGAIGLTGAGLVALLLTP